MVHVTIMGRLGKDPTEYKEYGNVTNFTVCSSRGKKYEPEWYSCSAWDSTADFIRKYFKTGSGIVVHGTQVRNEWEKDGQIHHDVEITVHSVNFPLSGGKKKEDGEEVIQPEITENNGQAIVAHCPDITANNK